MDFKRLEYFVRVAELGSFTRAAKELGVVQSALSRQMNLLEQELERELLTRKGHGVAPTLAGMRLLEHARGILQQAARAREDVMRMESGLAGRVAVGIPPGVARLLTMPLAREFRQRLPSASLCINEAMSGSLCEWLLAGRIDIGLVYDPRPVPELTTTVLMEEALFLVSPARKDAAASPVNLKEVAGLPLILPSRPNNLRTLIETKMAEFACRPRVALEIDASNSMLDLVADGAGHTILPVQVGLPGPERFSVRVISDFRRTLMMATAVGRPTTLTQETMQELVREVVREILGSTEAG